MTAQTKELTNQMMQFVTAKWISKPIYVAAKLGISDILSDGPMTIEQIARECDAHAPYLYRMLRVLSSVEIYSEIEEKKFQSTPMSDLLKTNAMRSIVLMFLSDWHDMAWGQLFHSVKTGKIAFNEAHAMDAFKWFEKNPVKAEIFYKANNLKAKSTARSIIDVYDFSNFNSIADIGGGFGGLLLEILKVNNSICGLIADLPHVKKHVIDSIESSGLNERCKFKEIDFFKEVPSDYEIYIMLNILHDWDDKHCDKILKNLYRAMTDKSKLLIIEMIIPEGNEFSISKLMDLEVLVMGGGSERTEKQFAELLNSADLRINRTIQTSEHVFIIECEKNKINLSQSPLNF